MTHPAEIALLRYADGERSTGTTDLTEHLAACAPCRAVVQESRRVGAALRALPAPAAPAAPPWTGVVIPPRRRSGWHAIAATFVAGILVGGTAAYVGESDVSLAGFMPTPATHAPALSNTPRPFGPGRWTYLSREYADSVLWANPYLTTVTVDSGSIGGVPAWLIVTTRPGRQPDLSPDSLWIGRRDFSPIAESWTLGRIVGSRRFTRDTMTIDYRVIGGRTRHVALPIPDVRQLHIADDITLGLYFRTVALDRSWRGSVMLLDYESPRIGSLSVVGRRTIATPIGPCDCWHVALTSAGRPRTLWVRVTDGTVVKTEGYAINELVAEDPLP